jgi:CheY-like chemotaxis protein
MPATILVVDDDPVILQLLQVNFEMEGFAVLTAADGQEGVARTKKDRPDVVVSDVMMPRMSGLELVAALRTIPKRRTSRSCCSRRRPSRPTSVPASTPEPTIT